MIWGELDPQTRDGDHHCVTNSSEMVMISTSLMVLFYVPKSPNTESVVPQSLRVITTHGPDPAILPACSGSLHETNASVPAPFHRKGQFCVQYR